MTVLPAYSCPRLLLDSLCVWLQDLAPPKELYIEVRVLEDVGEIATEEGSVNLEKDTQVRTQSPFPMPLHPGAPC